MPYSSISGTATRESVGFAQSGSLFSPELELNWRVRCTGPALPGFVLTWTAPDAEVSAIQWTEGFLGGTVGKESICQGRRHKGRGFDPWVEKILWSRKWQPTPVFLLRKCHRPISLAGCSPWGCRELDMTEHALQMEPDAEVSAGQWTEELGERAWSLQPTQWATWGGSNLHPFVGLILGLNQNKNTQHRWWIS